jgi:hypothetical protein
MITAKERPAIGPTSELQPHLKEFAAFLAEFNKETERGVALTAAAFLGDLLQNVIESFLIANKNGKSLTDGFNAPLGTLSARIAGCHAMGLISPEEFRECEAIRKIRNEFAHKMNVVVNPFAACARRCATACRVKNLRADNLLQRP